MLSTAAEKIAGKRNDPRPRPGLKHGGEAADALRET
jgi:hypothetical protein